jgi:hypothetical protein
MVPISASFRPSCAILCIEWDTVQQLAANKKTKHTKQMYIKRTKNKLDFMVPQAPAQKLGAMVSDLMGPIGNLGRSILPQSLSHRDPKSEFRGVQLKVWVRNSSRSHFEPS